MKTQNERDLFIELRSTGLSLEKISIKMNISKPTLVKWCQECSVEIENLRAISQDTILNELQLSKETYFKRVVTIYSKVLDEIEGRDLSSIPLDKLLKVMEDLKPQLQGSLTAVVKTEKKAFGVFTREYEETSL